MLNNNLEDLCTGRWVWQSLLLWWCSMKVLWRKVAEDPASGTPSLTITQVLTSTHAQKMTVHLSINWLMHPLSKKDTSVIFCNCYNQGTHLGHLESRVIPLWYETGWL
jgi:hypothetical protein